MNQHIDETTHNSRPHTQAQAQTARASWHEYIERGSIAKMNQNTRASRTLKLKPRRSKQAISYLLHNCAMNSHKNRNANVCQAKRTTVLQACVRKAFVARSQKNQKMQIRRTRIKTKLTRESSRWKIRFEYRKMQMR